MKQFVFNLAAIAAISFTLSFAVGMSASMMYQEHQSLKSFIAAQEVSMKDVAVLSAAETDISDLT